MIIEANADKSKDLPESIETRQETLSQAAREEPPFHVVTAPPIPGQTTWSIVPW